MGGVGGVKMLAAVIGDAGQVPLGGGSALNWNAQVAKLPQGVGSGIVQGEAAALRHDSSDTT